ncbi:hypothetical protein JCM16358_11660 [Halanaerocella petrolearia]
MQAFKKKINKLEKKILNINDNFSSQPETTLIAFSYPPKKKYKLYDVLPSFKRKLESKGIENKEFRLNKYFFEIYSEEKLKLICESYENGDIKETRRIISQELSEKLIPYILNSDLRNKRLLIINEVASLYPYSKPLSIFNDDFFQKFNQEYIVVVFYPGVFTGRSNSRAWFLNDSRILKERVFQRCHTINGGDIK